MPASLREEIEAQIATVREATQGDDAEAMTQATDALITLSQQIGSYLYSQSESAATAETDQAARGHTDREDEDVIDVEYEG